MKTILAISAISVSATGIAICEPLERRYGADHARGYRIESEYDGLRSEFRNIDRANFLGGKPEQTPEEFSPRMDLHGPSLIGLQR